MPLTKAVIEMRQALPTYTASPRIKNASDIARKLNPNYSSPEPGLSLELNFRNCLNYDLDYSNGYEDQGRYEDDRYSQSEEEPSQYEEEASQTEEDEPPGIYSEDEVDEQPGQYDNYSDEDEDYEEHRRHDEHYDEEPPMVFHGSVRSPPKNIRAHHNGHDGSVEAVRESPVKTIQAPEDISGGYNKDEIPDEINDAGPVEDFSETCSVTLSQATGCEISELASDSEFSEMGKV